MGQIFTQAASFVRNIIIARILSPEDMGIAATFAITISLLEMASNLSTDKLLIQSSRGGEAIFQEMAQVLEVMRGLILSVFIFLLASPASTLFGVQDAQWAFQLLAVIPLLRGFVHLDMFRFQRKMKYFPSVAAESVSIILTTVVAWPICVLFSDYFAMLLLMIIRVIVLILISHFFAERSYRWNWNKLYAKEFFAFGWPLLVNGLFLFVIFQGDRFIIGSGNRLFSNSTYTLSDLAVYSVAFNLAMLPTMIVSRISTSIFLPLLSSVQNISLSFSRRYTFCSQVVALAGGVITIPLIVAGRWIVPMIYGQKYVAAGELIGWLAMMQAVRTMRVAPTLAAMARSDTRNAMVANFVRILALFGVIGVVMNGGNLVLIAVMGLLGELLALGVCVGRLQSFHGIQSKICLKPFAVSSMMIISASVVASTDFFINSLSATLLLTIGSMFLIPVGMLILFQDLRGDLLGSLNRMSW